MNGSIYERELASLLAGREDQIKRFSKKLDETERGIISSLISKPFYVTRSAGSLGADLIALRSDFSFVIEVKSSISDTLMFTEASGQRQEQAERLMANCARAGLFVIYAFRIKNASGDPWRIFSTPSQPVGRMRQLYDRIPKIGMTKNGNFFLKWRDGMPLIKIIDYVNQEV